ncbi:hypothetical protein B0H11DRAFT_2349974 [Mycena galericulata]|nr:hypothetical protein B0H11DRAFT_2349974 [Mycena galericulata]
MARMSKSTYWSEISLEGCDQELGLRCQAKEVQVLWFEELEVKGPHARLSLHTRLLWVGMDQGWQSKNPYRMDDGQKISVWGARKSSDGPPSCDMELAVYSSCHFGQARLMGIGADGSFLSFTRHTRKAPYERRRYRECDDSEGGFLFNLKSGQIRNRANGNTMIGNAFKLFRSKLTGFEFQCAGQWKAMPLILSDKGREREIQSPAQVKLLGYEYYLLNPVTMDFQINTAGSPTLTGRDDSGASRWLWDQRSTSFDRSLTRDGRGKDNVFVGVKYVSEKVEFHDHLSDDYENTGKREDMFRV